MHTPHPCTDAHTHAPYPHPPTHTGPVSSRGTHHPMHPCIVPDAREHIWGKETKLIDEMSCDVTGRAVELDMLEKPEYYPLENVLFFTPIPYIKDQVMSRLFHFLIADIGFSFVSSDYSKKVMSKSIVYTSPIMLLLSVSLQLSPNLFCLLIKTISISLSTYCVPF